MLLRALRKLLLDMLMIGTPACLCVIAWWCWREGLSLGSTVLLALIVGAVSVSCLMLAVFALMVHQYLRHHIAVRDALRRSAQPQGEQQKSPVLRQMVRQQCADRDPRVIPWWEW